MDREIKFRVRNLEDNKFENLSEIIITIDGAGIDIYRNNGSVLYGYELNQYTGLKDIRGKEIYEGDIIRHKNPKPFKDSIYKVVFLNGGFAIKNSDYVEDINEFLKESRNAEVIGNLYEDSELL